ncbi:MAG: PAS domain S-box protein [Proteobacteria bacterium]|nr:PAS domain S-box protein [Pseudomonadota bacterium]MBI3496953.1 PAS domain S-box protein [Pseudomonadota bacterium]
MSRTLRTLIVDDSADDARLLAYALTRGGFEPELERIDTAEAMTAALQRGPWDIVLCDHQLPRFDIASALALLRQARLDIPFIVVSGVIGEERAIEVMRLGAHDLILKDNLARLVPAIERELSASASRRREAAAAAGLARSNEQLRGFAVNLPGLVYRRVLHPDGRVEYPFVGGNFLTALGVDSDQASKGGIDLRRWLHPEDLEPWNAALARSIKDLQAMSYELRLVLPSGEVRWISSYSRARREEDGRIVWDAVAIDTTERRAAERALDRSRQRFRDIAELASDWIWESDSEHRLTYLSGNPTGKASGDAAGLIRKALWELPGPEGEPRNRPRELARHAPFDDFRLDLVGADSRIHRFSVSGRPIFAVESGTFRGYRGVATDVTAIIEAERKRTEAEAYLRDAVESISEGFVIYDADDRLVTSNAKYAAIYERSVKHSPPGTTFEEIIRRGVAAGEYVEAFGREEEWIQQRLYQHQHPGTDVEQQLANGRWLLITDRRMRNGGIAGLRMDITQRKQADEALRQSEERYRRVVDVLPTAIVVHVDGRIVFANPAAARLFGAESTNRLIGMHALDLVHPDEREDVSNNVERALQNRVPDTLLPIERTILRLDGSTRVVEIIGIPMDYAGKTGVLAAASDITERRVAERERQELQSRFQQSQKMEAVGRLTGGIAHDFNNLLQIVLGNLELARDRCANDATAVGQLDAAIAAGMRGADLIQRLLSFSRQQPLMPTAVDLKQRISGLVPLLRRALGESIDIRHSHEAGLWPVVTDPSQFDNAILNLAINARDAMPGGGWLHIETENSIVDATYAAQRPGLAVGDYARVSMTDCGIGMPPEVLERVFEPFFTTKEPGKGTGLGLSMIYGYANQSGGHLSIYSEVGLGTTVSILLPRSRTDAAASAVIEPAPGLPSRASETILVVEDDPDVRALTLAFLQELGYRTLDAGSAAEALKILGAGHDIDLLLSDVVLPGRESGTELAAQAYALRPDLKVMFMSGYTREAMIHEGRLDPGVVLLHKPFSKHQLVDKVRSVLDSPGPAAPADGSPGSEVC